MKALRKVSTAGNGSRPVGQKHKQLLQAGASETHEDSGSDATSLAAQEHVGFEGDGIDPSFR